MIQLYQKSGGGLFFMRYFSVNVRKKTTEYNFMPTLQLYLIEENDKPRPIVVIAPGGGYLNVCIKEDGEKTALQYNAAGFHAAVLNYCVKPHCFPEPQIDFALSIKLLRDNAEELGIEKNMIAVCGFSAGGHLCASLSTLWNNNNLFVLSEIQSEIYKPNASILFSAILTAKIPHCKEFLAAHAGGDPEKLKLVSCDEQVNEKTPPAFLYNTFEDQLTDVKNVLYYAESLKKYNVPFELHVFPKGNHGESWCDNVIWSKPAGSRDYGYLKLSIDWIKELFGL